MNINKFVVFHADFRWPTPDEIAAAEELAEHLAASLTAHGISVEEVDGDELGHEIKCGVGDSTITLWVTADTLKDEPGDWTAGICAKQTFFGDKPHAEDDVITLVQALDACLQESERIWDIRWYPHFETPDYLALMTASDGPICDPELYEQMHPVLRRDMQLMRLTNLVCGLRGFLLFACVYIVLRTVAPQLAHLALGVFAALFLVFVFLVPVFSGYQIRKEAAKLDRSMSSHQHQSGTTHEP